MSVSNADLTQLDQVTLVIVTFESAHCLPDLEPLIRGCKHVIIVDNGSTDGTASLAHQHFPHAHIIALERNYGFGAANNRALEKLTTPFALLLNPDCQISPEHLALLVSEAHHYPDAAILAPQLANTRGEPDLSYRWPSSLWASRGPGASGPSCVGFVTGAAMLLVPANMGNANRFDEGFFLYYEDDDLCLRLFNDKRSIILVPQVVAIHRSRGSVRGKARVRSEYWRGYHHAQSKLRFAEKHLSVAHSLRLKRKTIALALLSWPLRLFLLSPRMLARLTGRIAGLMQWRPHA